MSLPPRISPWQSQNNGEGFLPLLVTVLQLAPGRVVVWWAISLRPFDSRRLNPFEPRTLFQSCFHGKVGEVTIAYTSPILAVNATALVQADLFSLITHDKPLEKTLSAQNAYEGQS